MLKTSQNKKGEQISSCTGNSVFFQLPAVKKHFWCSLNFFRPFLFREGFRDLITNWEYEDMKLCTEENIFNFLTRSLQES